MTQLPKTSYQCDRLQRALRDFENTKTQFTLMIIRQMTRAQFLRTLPGISWSYDAARRDHHLPASI